MVFPRLIMARKLRIREQIAVASLMAVAGCGAPAEVDSGGMPAIISTSSGDQKGGSSDAQAMQGLMTPPREYYENLFGEVVDNTDRGAYSLADLDVPKVLWLSFSSLDVPKGTNRGQSFLVCGDTAKIPTSTLTPADQTTITTAIQAAFDRSGLNVNVTATRPTAGAFSTLALGGTYADLGCKDPAMLGIAPFDQGDANPRDVAFVFTAAILAAKGGVSQVQTEAILQAGRAYGVADLSKESASNRSQGGRGLAGVAGFDNLPAPLANLPGLSQLAGIAKVLPELTADMIVDISSIMSNIENLFPTTVKSVNLPSLDRSLTVIHMANNAANGNNNSPGVSVGTSTSTSTSPTVVNNSKSPTFNAGGAANILSSLSGALNGAKSILSIFGGGTSTQTPQTPTSQPMLVASSMTTLPDLISLMGLLDGDVDLGTLIRNYIGTTQLINGNYTGAERDALLSFIKTAYAQAYQKLMKRAGS